MVLQVSCSVQKPAVHPSRPDMVTMEAIAACTIGGVSVTGGRGKVSSAIIGVAVFELLKVALQYLGMNANAQYIAIGVVIFIAISGYQKVYSKKVKVYYNE